MLTIQAYGPRLYTHISLIFFQTINQLLEKIKQGEHVFDVNAEPEPEEDDGPDFDADYEEGGGDCEERSKESKEGCEASGSGKGR